MKYCNHCGKELVDEAEFCTSCGCRVATTSNKNKPIRGTLSGFALSFFLGLIGFLLALFLGDEPCEQAATKTFIICFIVKLLLVIIVYVMFILALLPSYH